MSESTAEATATEAAGELDEQGNPAADETAELGDAGKQALDRMKAERNEAKKSAAALQKQLDDFKKASMTEAEKAVAEAEERGRTSATTEFGKELAQTQFDALAGRRNPDFDTSKALEYVDLAKFLGEDGRPDAAAIKAAVERLVPEPAGGPPSFDGGVRTSTTGTDFNQVLRRAAGRA